MVIGEEVKKLPAPMWSRERVGLLSEVHCVAARYGGCAGECRNECCQELPQELHQLFLYFVFHGI